MRTAVPGPAVARALPAAVAPAAAAAVPVADAPTGARPSRTAWVDVAKGLSIVLVALHHVVVAADAQGWTPEVTHEVSSSLGTLRMPLFFLASGLFATRTLAGPWGRLLERRVAFFAWLYVLWLVIRYLWFGLLAHGVDIEAWASPWTVVSQLWLPASGMWFLYALALFSLLGRLTRAVPPVVRIGAAAGLSAVVGAGIVEVDSYAWRSMALNLVFFLLGADASGAIRRRVDVLGRRAAVGLALGAGAGFVALTLALRDPDVVAVPGARLATSLVALVAGVALAAALAGTRAGRAPQWLGTRTLEVYLIHGLLLGAVAALVGLVHPGGFGADRGVVLVLVTTGVVVVGSLAAARGLRAVGGGWLFAPPWHGRRGARVTG